jgi:DNA polymerase III subunit delta'
MAEIEPDQQPGAEHPRRTRVLEGHDAEEAALAEGLFGPRPHHAWMLTGPKGAGKATLAYRAARAILGARLIGPRPLDCAPDDPIARRVDGRAHPDLLVIRCGLNDKGKPRREITAEEARSLSGFFSLQPAEGGWRVAIIDAVDDLNRTAANAILKTLEEPPAKAVILLVCHAPGAILPTIRSRTRRLALRALPDASVRAALEGTGLASPTPAIIRMAAGLPGRAIALAALNASDVERALADGLEMLARGRPAALAQLSQGLGAAPGPRAGLILAMAKEAARTAALAGQGLAPETGAPWLQRLALPERASRWAGAYETLSQIESQFNGLDMDPSLAVSRALAVLAETAT